MVWLVRERVLVLPSSGLAAIRRAGATTRVVAVPQAQMRRRHAPRRQPRTPLMRTQDPGPPGTPPSPASSWARPEEQTRSPRPHRALDNVAAAAAAA